MGNRLPSNTIARNEILIILDYLLHECDEKHPAKQSDIIDYSLKKYNVEIKRQRIGTALFDLKCFTDAYKDILPFEVKEICTGKKFKYYATIKTLNKNEIDTVLSAIRNDRYTTFHEYKNINNKLLSLITNKYSAEEFKKSVKTNIQFSLYYKRGAVFSKKTLAKVKDAIKNKKCATIRVINMDNIKLEKNIVLDDKTFNCYFYKIIRFNDVDYAVGVINLYDTWFSIPLDDIEIIKSDSFIDDIKNYNYNDHFKAPKGYETIQDYLRVHLLPYDEKVINVCFRFPKQYNLYQKIKKSFNSHFNKLMKRCYVIDEITKKEMHEVNFKVQAKLFKEWIFSDLSILNNIQLVYPKTLMDELINTFENSIQHLKNDILKFKDEHEYIISLFKDEQTYYFSDKPTPIYSENFTGTYEEANVKAEKIMEQYKAEFKLITPKQ